MTAPRDLDVDARFLLANERTLLAWLRTALTLVAAGLGTLQLVEQPWAEGPGLVLLALGTAAATVGLLRYREADRALRRGALPRAGAAPALLAGAVAVAAGALLVLHLVAELP